MFATHRCQWCGQYKYLKRKDKIDLNSYVVTLQFECSHCGARYALFLRTEKVKYDNPGDGLRRRYPGLYEE
jgi:hypothetical protein